MNFEEELAARTREVQEILYRYLPEETGEQKTLLEAMNYSMKAGGKRLRPLLILLSFEQYGGAGDLAYPFMAAMEMIHTHSLIHDDLPAMDNDEYRRGRKTTHIVYGEAMAILAGDALLNHAYETAAGAFRLCGDDPALMARTARALQILSQKSGITGMIGGQSVDVQMEGLPLTEGQVDFIYELKTAALIEASLMIGAALAGAGEQEIALQEQIGRRVGLAFQIRDDILDVSGDQATLGKPIGSDEKNNKTTYVTLRGLEQADDDAKKLTREAEELLRSCPKRHAFLEALLASLAGRNF